MTAVGDVPAADTIDEYWGGDTTPVGDLLAAAPISDYDGLDATPWGDLPVTDEIEDWGVAGPGPPGTPPVAGFLGYWDARDAADIQVSGDQTTQWDDRSGNGNHAVPDHPDVRPVYGVTSDDINGVQCPDFQGDDRIDLPLPGGDTTMTVFFVAKRNIAFGAGAFTDLCGSNGATNNQLVLRADQGGNWFLLASHVALILDAGYGPTVDVPFAVAARTNGSTNSLQMYGEALVTQTLGNVGGSNMRIGADKTGTNWRGPIGTILYYGSALSDVEIQDTLDWLAEEEWLIA